MKVSVIIPYYRGYQTIDRALNSVFRQTFRDFEIIIINDGSEDLNKLDSIVKRYQEYEIKILSQKVNRGQIFATKLGIQHAKGSYIGLLDCDDEWEPQKLERQIKVYEARCLEKLVLYTKSAVVTKTGGPVRTSVLPERAIAAGERISEYLFCQRGFIQSSSIFFPKQLMKSFDWPDFIQRHTDYSLLFEFERLGCHFFMLSEVLTLVHWEDVEFRRKNRSLDRSFQFVTKYKESFFGKSRSLFILNQMVLPKLKTRDFDSDLIKAVRLIGFRDLGFFELIQTLSVLLFGDPRMLQWCAWFKRLLQVGILNRHIN